MKWKWMEAEEDAIKPEPEFTDALKLLIALTAAAAAAPLMSLLFTLRSSFHVEPYCAASFWSIVYHSLDFFMSAQFCSTGESSKIEKKTSLTEF